VQAAIPNRAGGTETKQIDRAHHHNQEMDYIDDQQPVELFVGNDGKLTVGDLFDSLEKYPQESLVRIAVPDDGFHRCLDIAQVGFGAEGDPPPCELRTELIDGADAVIRMDDHKVGEDLGDQSYTREGAVVRDAGTGEVKEVPKGALKTEIAGRAPEQK
jgi:hypothetical protein